jgi:CRISPR-associated endonuclease Csn1
MKGVKMTISIGLDIGTNSVGSAWVDTENELIAVGVSVFPAGVDETEDKRGAPKNQVRRAKRSLRRSLARRSARKRHLRHFLAQNNLLPTDAKELQALFTTDAWELRDAAITRELTPHEFGRVMLHLCQRRGALGLKLRDDEEGSDDEDGEVKGAVSTTRRAMSELGAASFGQMMAFLSRKRKRPLQPRCTAQHSKLAEADRNYSDPIRNRRDSFEFHADRRLIREEFRLIWDMQKSNSGLNWVKRTETSGELAQLLTEELRNKLDDPTQDTKWHNKGHLFGQRRTYWNTGTLGRCDLEPSERCVPIADRYASYYRVVESVNNIRLREPWEREFRSLTTEERRAVIDKLQEQKTGTVKTVRKALGIDKATLKKRYPDYSEQQFVLNIERDEDCEINTDWFYREIVHSIGEVNWEHLSQQQQEGINRAILRLDPGVEADAERLRAIAQQIDLPEDAVNALIAGWETRPKLEKRLKLSRRAIRNLLPYMEQCDDDKMRWPTQIEARKRFAQDKNAVDQTNVSPAKDEQKQRYQLAGRRLNKRDRHFLNKHPEFLPPPPMLANPVVRKAIFEVRRHVVAYLRKFKKKPDRIVIEFARETTKPAKVNDQIVAQNRTREKARKKALEEVVKPAFGSKFKELSHNQIQAATDRVLLCEQQNKNCPYSSPSKPITPRNAALGTDLEIDHIIPYSRCGDNSLTNRVLCYVESNRNKREQTPREWWSNSFDSRACAMRFMENHAPAANDYFSRREYELKWSNFSRVDTPKQWKGSQLSDTAYAAREVQLYLAQVLWPNEVPPLDSEQRDTHSPRRIFVTKGAYTSRLRKDWQLYLNGNDGGESPEEAQRLAAKNRGDHREHAVDAVVIALTDSDRILDLAGHARMVEEQRYKMKSAGVRPSGIKRDPLNPPWSDVPTFRQQVLSLIYEECASASEHGEQRALVVSHRTGGYKITGAFHKDSLFGPVLGKPGFFVRRRKIDDLDSNQLRLPKSEPIKTAIARIVNELRDQAPKLKSKDAKELAEKIVNAEGYKPRLIEPSPGKSGLVRDNALRVILRAEITRRFAEYGIPRNADKFSDKDLAKILRQKDDPKTSRPLCMPSGVPIKSVVLLRVMFDPVIIKRRRYNIATSSWCAPNYGTLEKDDRVYDGQSNHHIEIRANKKNRWSGRIIPTYEAAIRTRIEKRHAVERKTDESLGGEYVMSLAQGDIVYMRHNKRIGEVGYYVVFKLDKPQTIWFKPHWDARRAKGEKDVTSRVLEGSLPDGMPVTASNLRDLAPPNEATPIKVNVEPLGTVRRVEPVQHGPIEPDNIDRRVMNIARSALAARQGIPQTKDKKRRPGSWKSMHSELEKLGLSALRAQLTQAVRYLRSQEPQRICRGLDSPLPPN